MMLNVFVCVYLSSIYSFLLFILFSNRIFILNFETSLNILELVFCQTGGLKNFLLVCNLSFHPYKISHMGKVFIL